MATMDTLEGSEWDVLIVGTDIPQSLLALALSRSGKRVLHIDKNEFYGGAEAAFSLQEAEHWAARIGQAGSTGSFRSASTTRSMPTESDTDPQSKLSSSRAYSLALAPQLIYTDSRLLSALVSSKAHNQLEFLPMGCFWVYTSGETSSTNDSDNQTESASSKLAGRLIRVPTTREDVVFSDPSIDIRARRSLMRVIRFIVDYESHGDVWEQYAERSFPSILREHFKLADHLHALLLAITLTPGSPETTTTAYALPRLARHLRSTGRLGAGFSSIIPRWGGISEICQVACRAAAVGGAVYVLGKSLSDAKHGMLSAKPSTDAHPFVSLALADGEEIRVAVAVAGPEEQVLATETCSDDQLLNDQGDAAWSRSISIVASRLSDLFPPPTGDSPSAAGTIVVLPSGSLVLPEDITRDSISYPPVYLIIHNHHTGECPNAQCIIYASTALSGTPGQALLDAALKHLFRALPSEPSPPVILWTLRYEQSSLRGPSAKLDLSALPQAGSSLKKLRQPILDLVFDDTVLDIVKEAWLEIVDDGVDSNSFLVFENRRGEEDEDADF